MLNELAKKINDNSIAHGFYDTDEDKNVLVKLMLVVSELGEACEAYRNKHYANLSPRNQILDINYIGNFLIIYLKNMLKTLLKMN